MAEQSPRTGSLFSSPTQAAKLRAAAVARRLGDSPGVPQPAGPPRSAAQNAPAMRVVHQQHRASKGPALWILLAIAVALGLACLAFMSGCSAAHAAAASHPKNQDCSQAAARPSCLASTSDNGITEGGVLGHHGGASGVDPVRSRAETAAAGGTAGNPESSGTGRVTRDRRGLVDAWPEVSASSCTSRPVPGSPMVVFDCGDRVRARL